MKFSVRTVTVTVHGATYEGMYYLQGSMVHVQSSFGKKAAQVRGSPPEAVAKMLLSGLVRASVSTD
jgi:hypothetical protein